MVALAPPTTLHPGMEMMEGVVAGSLADVLYPQLRLTCACLPVVGEAIHSALSHHPALMAVETFLQASKPSAASAARGDSSTETADSVVLHDRDSSHPLSSGPALTEDGRHHPPVDPIQAGSGGSEGLEVKRQGQTAMAPTTEPEIKLSKLFPGRVTRGLN